MKNGSGFTTLLLCVLTKIAASQTPIPCNSTATARILVGNAYPTEITGNVGGILQLMCQIDTAATGVTFSSYTWQHNGQIKVVATSETLHLQPLTSGDGGQYRCRSVVVIERGVTCQTSYSNNVTVTTIPSITTISPSASFNIMEGQSIQLSCDAEGYPPPTFEWYRSDAKSTILSGQAVYSVQAADVTHSGTYVCRASNVRGHSLRNVSVTVTALPPTMTELSTTKPVTTGSPTTRLQSATGNVTLGTVPTVSSTAFYIGIAVVCVVSVVLTLLTVLCCSVWFVFSSKQEIHEADCEEEVDPESLKQQVVDVEEATFQDMIDTQGHHEVIPLPKKKKTRGKHRKF